jgi:hypothetical protein
MSDFRVIQGCPCNPLIAPYFALLAHETGAVYTSIYRGDDARAILNAHGKHSQRQLRTAWERGEAARFGILGTPDRPGTSSHELFSDGVAFRGPVGRRLEDWEQGIDADEAHVERLKRAARHHGWELFQPYRSGAERHHLNFRRRPRAVGSTFVKIVALRRDLPRR